MQMKNYPELYTRIWKMVKTIPKGHVATYGQIARLCDLGRQARLVGYALHNLKSNSGVPWHRVVNSKGTISFPKHTDAYKLQKKLLEKEGVVFIRSNLRRVTAKLDRVSGTSQTSYSGKGEKIDLSKYGVGALAISSPASGIRKSKIP